jgi:hypothetical protein
MYNENVSLTPAQLKKLASCREHDTCYVVLIGNLLYCLVHRIYTDNTKRCQRAQKRG